jgi:preprotein translocase subunit Sss1
VIITLAVSVTTLLAVCIVGVIGYLIDKSADERDKK